MKGNTKNLYHYLLPATSALVIIALYVIIDSIFIGQALGKEALAALNIAYPIITLASSISLMIGMGVSTKIGLAQREESLTEELLSYIPFLNVLFYIAILIFVFGFPRISLFFLGASGTLLPLVLAYLFPCSIGLIFLMISTGWNAVVRNLSAPRYAFFSMLMGALCNIFFDWLFLFPMQLGISGAAIATAMGQILSFFLLFFFFRYKKIRLHFYPKQILLEKSQSILALGFSSFIMEFAAAITLVLFNRQFMNYVGEIGVAAFCVVASSFYLFRMLFTGLGQGLQPLLSYHYGKKEEARVSFYYRETRNLSFVLALICFALVLWKKREIIALFYSEEAFLEFTANSFLAYSTAIFFLCYNLLNISYYQAIGEAKRANLFSLCRSFLFLVPILYLLPILFGEKSLWFVLCLTEFATSLAIFVVKRRKRLGLKNR